MFMKIFVVLLTMLSLCIPTFAQIQVKNSNNLPIGTFKKKKNGTIVQYDKNGKIIGKYKIENTNYKKHNIKQRSKGR